MAVKDGLYHGQYANGQPAPNPKSRRKKLGRSAKTVGKSLLGGPLGLVLGAKKAINNYNDKDFFGNPSNINSDITGIVNPNAERGNENVDPSQLSPEVRQKMQDQIGQSSGAKSFLLGEPGKKLSFDLLTPDQQDLFKNHVLPHILNQLGPEKSLEEYGKEFDPTQYLTQFQEQTIPNILNQFGSTGAAASSPLLATSLQQGTRQLGNDLYSRRNDFAASSREADRRNRINLLSQGLAPQKENAYSTRQPGAVENITGQTLGPLLQLAAKYYTGGVAA